MVLKLEAENKHREYFQHHPSLKFDQYYYFNADLHFITVIKNCFYATSREKFFKLQKEIHQFHPFSENLQRN